MTREAFIGHRFNRSSIGVIAQANSIINEYQGYNITLTLRQLYYQFVARDLIENNMRSYKRLGSILSKARLAGMVDWTAIEDTVRQVHAVRHYDNPGEAIFDAMQGFYMSMWQTQEQRVEVWIEKDALMSVISSPCLKLDVPYLACKGYNSQSAMWKAKERFKHYKKTRGQDTILIYLGDHDPSGVDMTRDIEDRQHLFGNYCKVERIALNMDQVQAFNPPPAPAKITDTRSWMYIKKFGNDSWELDALDPMKMRNIVEHHIEKYIDWDKWHEREALETEYRGILRHVHKNWHTIEKD